MRIRDARDLVKSHKEVTKQKKSRFFLLFLEGSGSGAGPGAGFVLVTNGGEKPSSQESAFSQFEETSKSMEIIINHKNWDNIPSV
jgi:hypothetical protein